MILTSIAPVRHPRGEKWPTSPLCQSRAHGHAHVCECVCIFMCVQYVMSWCELGLIFYDFMEEYGSKWGQNTTVNLDLYVTTRQRSAIFRTGFINQAWETELADRDSRAMERPSLFQTVFISDLDLDESKGWYTVQKKKRKECPLTVWLLPKCSLS